MRLIIHSIKRKTYFYAVVVAYLIVSATFLLTHTKSDSFYTLFGKHSFLFNSFFQVYTFLGDGIFAILLCLFLYWRKQKQLALTILICFLLSGAVAQLLKNIVFMPRPKLYLDEANYLFTNAGLLDVRSGNSSFPSGHTTTTFSILFVLVMHSRSQLLHLFLFCIALLVGYSRIYLGQHFPEDVFAGSIIGLACGAISFVLANSKPLYALYQKRAKKFNPHWPNSIQTS